MESPLTRNRHDQLFVAYATKGCPFGRFGQPVQKGTSGPFLKTPTSRIFVWFGSEPANWWCMVSSGFQSLWTLFILTIKIMEIAFSCPGLWPAWTIQGTRL